ncbi:MAG: DUF2812 domain-containing protein [Alistipes sp.]|nr:DUF2812 domain-containing protein [Alistipes sp.]
MMEEQITKRVWRFWTIAEYEQEEQWINEMARDGWALTAVGFCRFIFRRTRPGEFIYKLDMVERTTQDEVKESYFNFLTECGIRIVGEYKDWIYLQKRAADGPFDMKNDTYAKLRKVNKIYSFAIRTICRLLRIFMVQIMLFSMVELFVEDPGIIDFSRGMMAGIGIGSVIALTLIWVPIVKKLRRQVNKLIDEIGVII